jgi:hypothetical protein
MTALLHPQRSPQDPALMSHALPCLYPLTWAYSRPCLAFTLNMGLFTPLPCLAVNMGLFTLLLCLYP